MIAGDLHGINKDRENHKKKLKKLRTQKTQLKWPTDRPRTEIKRAPGTPNLGRRCSSPSGEDGGERSARDGGAITRKLVR